MNDLVKALQGKATGFQRQPSDRVNARKRLTEIILEFRRASDEGDDAEWPCYLISFEYRLAPTPRRDAGDEMLGYSTFLIAPDADRAKEAILTGLQSRYVIDTKIIHCREDNRVKARSSAVPLETLFPPLPGQAFYGSD